MQTALQKVDLPARLRPPVPLSDDEFRHYQDFRLSKLGFPGYHKSKSSILIL